MTVKMTMEEFKDLESKSKECTRLKELVCDCMIIQDKGINFSIDRMKFYKLYRACGGRKI